MLDPALQREAENFVKSEKDRGLLGFSIGITKNARVFFMIIEILLCCVYKKIRLKFMEVF